jgi:hypothetical protein
MADRQISFRIPEETALLMDEIAKEVQEHCLEVKVSRNTFARYVIQEYVKRYNYTKNKGDNK